MARFQVRSQSITVVAVFVASMIAVMSSSCAEAYAFGPGLSRKVRFSPSVKNAGGVIHKRREDGSAVTLYLFPTPPSISAANHQRSRRSTSSVRPNNGDRRSKSQLPAMSDSVLAESDTLPSFQTAHGLLSPEVVSRIADANELEMNGPLHRFLKTYKSRGPMACVSMLSDPEVLPELTRAMRDIA